jgi:hypothetical protein
MSNPYFEPSDLGAETVAYMAENDDLIADPDPDVEGAQ